MSSTKNTVPSVIARSMITTAVHAAGGIAIAVGGIVTLVTAHAWRAGGRRYRRDTAREQIASGSRPHDAIDSWDDLSHGDDPTAR